MRRVWIVIIIAAVLGIALILYRTRFASGHLRVDPHAREQIEKAKRR